MGEYELPKTLEEGKAFVRSLITEKPIPETFFAMLDMLDEVTDTMTYSHVRYRAFAFFIIPMKMAHYARSWLQLHQIREGRQLAFQLGSSGR